MVVDSKRHIEQQERYKLRIEKRNTTISAKNYTQNMEKAAKKATSKTGTLLTNRLTDAIGKATARQAKWATTKPTGQALVERNVAQQAQLSKTFMPGIKGGDVTGLAAEKRAPIQYGDEEAMTMATAPKKPSIASRMDASIRGTKMTTGAYEAGVKTDKKAKEEARLAKPMRVGGVAGKGGLLEKLQTNNEKDQKTEKSKRRKGLTYGPKAAIATIASLLMLKSIRNNLEKSSGYLGAVLAILGRVLLMALMPIATILGALLMPTTLKLLDIMKGVLDKLKGPMGDLIGGKIDVAEFVAIALPIWGDAMRAAGSAIGDGLINIAQQLVTIWPYIETELIKSWTALTGWLKDNWDIIEPILTGAWEWIASKLETIANYIIPLIGPALVWAWESVMDYLARNPEVKESLIKLLILALAIMFGPALIGAIIGAIPGIVLIAMVAIGSAFAIMGGSLEEGLKGIAVALVIVIGAALLAIGLALGGIPVGLVILIASFIIVVAGVLAIIAYKLGQMFGEFLNSFETIKDNFINGIIAAVDSFTGGLASALQSIIAAIRNAASNALRGAMNAVGLGKGTTGGKIVSGAATVASKQSGAVGLVGKIGKWLGLAEGGIVNKPTFAMIGEAGPEAVIPLSKMGGMGGGTTNNISINIQADVSSDVDIDRLADQISQKIYDNTRRSTSW